MNKMSPWVERHRPKYFSEVKGQDEAIYKIRRFLEEFNSEKSKFVSQKDEKGFELAELN